MAKSRTRAGLALGVVAGAWRRRSRLAGAIAGRGSARAQHRRPRRVDARDVRCVERPEGCVWCEGRGPTPPLVEPDALPAVALRSQGPGRLRRLLLAPGARVRGAVAHGAELPAADRAGVPARDLPPRHRRSPRGASCRGESPTRPAAASRARRSASGSRAPPILDEVSGKDGSFRLRLRAGPWTYSVRVSHPGAGHRDRRPAHRSGRDDRRATSAWRPRP